MAFGQSETSPAAGVRLAGGSKNTISQVVSHELKIARHSFPVRLPQLPHPTQTPTPTFLQLTVFRDRRTPSSQPDDETSERGRGEQRKRRREEEGKEKSDVNT